MLTKCHKPDGSFDCINTLLKRLSDNQDKYYLNDKQQEAVRSAMLSVGHGNSDNHEKPDSCDDTDHDRDGAHVTRSRSEGRKDGPEGKAGKKPDLKELELCKKLVLLLAMSNEEVVAELSEILRLINADLEVPADIRGPDAVEWGPVIRNEQQGKRRPCQLCDC